MPSEYATREPAPDPRPGPTGTPFPFAQLMKSATIRKYPGKPICWMVLISNSSRSRYLGSCPARAAASG
ncbi:hypothetical protein D3C83_07720 [compost metagenome]